jgi:hypothetical protein
LMAILMFPGLLAVYFLISLLYASAFAALSAAGLFLFSKVFKRKIGLRQTILICLYAMTIFLLIFPFFLMLHTLLYSIIWLPLAYASIGVILSWEKKRVF